MTTTVKLITHGWPVEITTTDHAAPGGEDVHAVSRVEPGTERDFYIHSTRSLSFKELPAEPTDAAQPAGEASAV